MSREIKFRAWDKGGNSWMPAKVMNDLLGIEVLDEGIFGFHDYRTHRYEFMQYTGLKDKNGVEIYEGDILRNNDKNLPQGVVVWSEKGYWGVRGYGWDDHPVELWKYAGDRKEIIGNIHQNPELLDPSQGGVK